MNIHIHLCNGTCKIQFHVFGFFKYMEVYVLLVFLTLCPRNLFMVSHRFAISFLTSPQCSIIYLPIPNIQIFRFSLLFCYGKRCCNEHLYTYFFQIEYIQRYVHFLSYYCHIIHQFIHSAITYEGTHFLPFLTKL